MDLSVLRRSDDSLETTGLPAKEPKLSYSIASLLQTVQRAKAVPALEREEKTEESDEDEEDEISVDSSPDTSEDDRLAVKVTEEDEEEPEDHQNPSLLDLRLGVPPHLLRPGLPLPLQDRRARRHQTFSESSCQRFRRGHWEHQRDEPRASLCGRSL